MVFRWRKNKTSNVAVGEEPSFKSLLTQEVGVSFIAMKKAPGRDLLHFSSPDKKDPGKNGAPSPFSATVF